MDEQLKTLKEVFLNKILRVPDYQRGYAWQDEQLNDFWDDLINLPETSNHYTGMLSLQMLDSEAVRDWANVEWKLDQGDKAYHVVDGQQRLTTFVILIQAIVELMESLPRDGSTDYLNHESLEGIRRQFLFDVNEESEAKLKTYIFGYEKDNPSYEFFKVRILGAEKSNEITETFYRVKLERAKKFFQNKLRRVYEAYDDDYDELAGVRKQGLADIQKIYRTLTQRMKFNVYEIKNDFDVFVTFETMNNRGKKLTTLELLKKRLIYLSTLFPIDNPKDSSCRDLPIEINKTWQVIYNYLGKNKQQVISDDDFLRDHWVMYFGYTSQRAFEDFLLKDYFSQKRIFAGMELDEDVDDSMPDGSEEGEEAGDEDPEVLLSLKKKLTLQDVWQYVESLRMMCKPWYDLHFPQQLENDNPLKPWLERLAHTQSANFRPLMLAITSSTELSMEQKVQALKEIESFVFLNYGLDAWTTIYQRNTFFNRAHKLFWGNIELETILDELEEKTVCMKTNEAGQKVLELQNISGRVRKLETNSTAFYSWPSLKYFLYEYEAWLRTEHRDTGRDFDYDVFAPVVRRIVDDATGEEKTVKDKKMSIEHVFPQTPDQTRSEGDSWAVVFGNYSDKEQKALNGSLGNLLLLSMRENRTAQNKEFGEKCERYALGSVAETEVCFDYANHGERRRIWDDKCILERGMKMLRFMEYRWGFKFVNTEEMVRFLGLEFVPGALELAKNC